MMEKISFKSLSKAQQIFLVIGFLAFLIIFSAVWRMIFAQTAPFTFSNVTATNIIGPGAQITWTTSAPAKFPWVMYGTTAGSGTQTNSSCSNDVTVVSTSHCINLVGLSPNTLYHYSVKASDESGLQLTSADFTFTSAAPINNPPPTPSAPIGPSTGMVGITYNYSAMLFPDPDGQQVKVVLDWGDGTPVSFSALVTPAAGGVASPSMSHSWSAVGTYGIKAKAIDSSGAESSWTPVYNMNITAAAGADIPAAPTNLVGTVSGSNVTLTWNDNSSNETGFKIYRGPTWTDIGNVGAGVTTFVDSNRGAGTYTYHINAFNSNNTYSPVSNDVSVTVTAASTSTSTDTTAPSTPPVPTLNIPSSSQINLSWPASSDNVGVTGYKIYRCACGNTSNMVLLTTVTGLTYSDTGLSGFTTYTYAVAAFDAAGNNSPQGPGASGTTAAGSGGTTTFPVAPSNLRISGTITSGSISLAWNDNSNNEDKFYIHRKLTTDSTWPSTGTIFSVSNNTTTYTDSSVSPGTSYDYRVQACNSSNVCSDFSYLIGTMTLGTSTTSASTTAPVAPTNLVGTVSGSNVTLTWNDNSSNETGFKIYRGPTWTDIGNVGAGVTTFVDSNRGAGTYTYHINAFNSNNTYSPVSNDVSVTVTAASTSTGTTTTTTSYIPSAPTSLLLNSISTPTFISLYWIDNSNNEDSFHLERKLSSTTTWSNLARTGSNVIYYIDTTGAPGMSYDYRVQSCLTGAGCSNYTTLEKVLISASTGSTNPTALTMPLPPTNLVLTSTSLPPVKLHWIDNSNNEDSFHVERKLNNTTTWSNLDHIDSNITDYSDTTVAPGVIYDYRVQACLTGAGCSNYTTLEKVLVSTTTSINGTTTTSATSTTTTPVVSTTTTSSTSTKTSLAPIPLPAPIAPTVTQGDIPQTTTQTTSQVTTQTTTTVATSNEFSSKVEGLGVVVEERKKAIDSSKEQLVKTINDSVADIINNATASGKKVDTSKIYTLRDELLIKVDSSLATLTAITPTDINNLQTEISKGINNIRSVAGEDIKLAQTNNAASINITSTLNTLSVAVNDQSDVLKAQGADLLYKDSNKDGISDYDSVYVYKINPTAPSPVSTYEGKTLNASQKVLLGFDPTQSALVKVNKEEPAQSTATVVPTYKVKEVALTDKKEVVFKGQALPNSFITIYIYSTPIIVTVKTDSSGSWQYVLDKELNNGDHTIYTATVNNSGNIIAKSSGFLFTKTAEAATLKDIPLVGAPVNTTKPGLLEGNSIYIVILILAIIIIGMLTLIGMTSKRNKDKI